MGRDTPAAVPGEKISHRFLTRVAVNTIDRARERLVSDSVDRSRELALSSRCNGLQAGGFALDRLKQDFQTTNEEQH